MLSINDVYTLENYARFATAVKECKAASKTLGCVVTSHLNGDFLSPCLHTSLDGGTTMMQALNFAQVDYACLGNHEFDMDKSQLETRLPLFKGKLINTNGMDEQLKSLPKYDVVEVGDKKVVFVGLCMTDKSIFAASNCPDMRPFVDSCTSAWEQAFKGQQVDVLVPMTHQFIEEDRLLAEQFEMHEALNSKVPVILGGHEHDIFEEMAADTLILKTGQDAAKIAVVDIWWASDGVKCRHSLIPAEKFKPEASAAAWANGRKKFVQTAMEAAITELPKDMSTKQCRFEPCDLGGFLLEKVKRGMQDRDVDIVLFNGGDIRGRKDYKAGPFTMGDLYNELAFHEPLAVVTMKGAQLAAAVKFSRAGTAEKPGFLHTDLDSEADKEHNLTKVNKRPFDAQKEYKVAVQRVMLTGMNNNTPLMEFGKANGVPSEELCRDAKEMVLVVCMKDMWRQVLGFGVWDSKSEGNVSPKKLREALIQAFEEMDKDKSGALDIKEIEQFLSKRLPNFASGSLATRLFQAADRDGNGKVNFEELANFVH